MLTARPCRVARAIPGPEVCRAPSTSRFWIKPADASSSGPTSWGMSTRILGACEWPRRRQRPVLHRVWRPIQIIVVPIPAANRSDTARVAEAVTSLLEELTLAGVRA